ncbi:transposable element Tc1 transposase [Trichonephila clavipes]|nr:transposable element Tc1 transposase [Trichonephila clavipes]
MALGGSLPQINLGVQGETQGVSTYCHARLQWCLDRSGWNHAVWGRIMFSDESRFQLCPDDNRRRVWIRPVQHAYRAFTIARQTCPQPGVIVWDAISFDSRISLVVSRGTLTALQYVDDILRTVLLSFLLKYSGIIFQLDNSRPYQCCCELSYSFSNTSLTI